ncbi:MAG: HlyC/CorC family transporter [Kouleothrix sp.]|nr:HlyC/CorC family transporter [Kouleothrix sp.]
MDPESSLPVIGILLCLVLLAFTSAVDAALSAIGRHRLNLMQEEASARATMVARLLSDPYRFKAAILLLNAAAIITATALTQLLTGGLSLGWRVGALALLLLLILILSEALPKALAIRNPARAARLLAGPMSLITGLLWPLISTISIITGPIVRLVSGSVSAQLPLVTEEELRLLVNVGEEEGLIEPDEREMIEGIFSFGDTVVREVMIPRVDIKALEEHASLDEALDLVMAHGHSRIPVYHETIDQIVGILYAKDLLRGLRSGRREGLPGAAPALADLVRAPHFVPETMKVDALLKDLQTRKVHLAIVVDEYGGTAGLATIEDLLEEIVGEIQDEYDVEEPLVQIVGEGELISDARVLLDDLNDLTGLQLSSDESDRIGGLVYERLGRVPKVGDNVQLDDDIMITVLSIEGLRPRQLRLTYPQTHTIEVSTHSGEATRDDDAT